MMSYLLQGVLIGSAFFLAYEILFRQFTFFKHNRYFLIFGMLCSFLVPLLPLNLSPEQISYIEVPRNALNSLNFENNATQSNSIINNLLPKDLWDGVAILYFLGVFIFGIRLTLQWSSVLKIIKHGTPKFVQGVRYVYTRQDVSPFSFFSTIVVNPNQVGDERWDAVITHEQIHIQQWHQLDVVLGEVYRVVFWFSPLTHFYINSLKLNLEYLTDSQSLLNGLNRKAYQLSLVQLSQQKEAPLLVNSFSKRILKNRVNMMYKMKTKSIFKWVYALTVPTITVGCLLLSSTVQSQQAKVKKVIVIADESLSKENLKLQYTDENGAQKDVNREDVIVVEAQEPDRIVIEERETSFENGKKQSLVKSETITLDENKEENVVTIISGDEYNALWPKKGSLEKLKPIVKGHFFSDTIIMNNQSKKIKGMIESLESMDLEEFRAQLKRLPKKIMSFKIDSVKFEGKDLDLNVETEFEENFRFFDLNKKSDFELSEKQLKKLSKKERRQYENIRKKVNSIEEPNVIIDGKRSTKKIMDNLEPDDIESMSVIKTPNKNEIHIKTKKKPGEKL